MIIGSMSKKIVFVVFVVAFLIPAISIYFIGGFYKSTDERELERILKMTVQLEEELDNLEQTLHAEKGRGLLLAEKIDQEGFNQVQITLARLEEPGFVVVTGKSNPDIIVERDQFRNVDIDWGVTPLLKAGEYEGLVVKQNLEQTKINRTILRYSVWRDDGDGVFDKQRDTFVRKHNYLLSGTQNEDGNVSVPYVKVEEPSFLLISGTYREALFNKSKIDALNVLGVSRYLDTDVYNEMYIPIDLDVSSTTYSYNVDVSIWIDNGDGVFNKYTDGKLKDVVQNVRLLREE